MKCPHDVLKALAAGPLSTAQLAKVLGVDRNAVYRCCRQMEARRELQSELEQGSRLLFCVEHRRVVTAEIYEECKANDHSMAVFFNQVRIWTRRRQASHAA